VVPTSQPAITRVQTPSKTPTQLRTAPSAHATRPSPHAEPRKISGNKTRSLKTRRLHKASRGGTHPLSPRWSVQVERRGGNVRAYRWNMHEVQHPGSGAAVELASSTGMRTRLSAGLARAVRCGQRWLWPTICNEQLGSNWRFRSMKLKVTSDVSPHPHRERDELRIQDSNITANGDGVTWRGDVRCDGGAYLTALR
jgi:hypothetical protein